MKKRKMVRLLKVVLCTMMIAAFMIMVRADFDDQKPGAGPKTTPLRINLEPPVKAQNPAIYPFTSLLFTVADVVFFSYVDNTMLQLFDSTNTLIWNNGGLPLNKGQHAHVTVAQGVYRAEGSKRFGCLSGDPITRYVVGYYAMDQNGFGASKELYTWAPQLYSHCKFVVFAYQNNTNVNVEYTDTGVDIATFTLNKGEHWDIETLSAQWIHVTADKLVSALTCYDQGYFVPSASGKWSGTEFYTYVNDIQGWAEDLTVIAYEDGTNVTIKDSDTDALVWSGTLNSGQAHVESYFSGANKFFDITSDKNVTVCVLPWVAWTSSYHQGAYVQDRDGSGIGTDLIGSTLNGGYLHVLSYSDNTNINIYNSQTGAFVANYTLNRGGSVNANPGNGLWRIMSDKPVSAYSGWGEWNADFVPVEFGEAVLDVMVDKECTSHPNGIADVGDTVTFALKVTNNGTNPIDILPLTDGYDTTYLSFLSATPSPNNTADDGQLDWSDLTTTLGNVGPGQSVTVTVNFISKAPTSPTTDNIVQMIGAKDTEGNTIPTASDISTLDINLIIGPPLNLSGSQEVNRSLLQKEYIHILTWQANPVNAKQYKNITNYRIYEVDATGAKTLLDEVDAATFEYWRRGVPAAGSYTYAVTAVHNSTVEGDAAQVTIGGTSQKTKNIQKAATAGVQKSQNPRKLSAINSKKD